MLTVRNSVVVISVLCILFLFGCDKSKPFSYDKELSSEISAILQTPPSEVLKKAEEGDNLSTAIILAYSVINDIKIVFNEKELSPVDSLTILNERAISGETPFIYCYGWTLYFKDNPKSDEWLEKAYTLGISKNIKWAGR